MTNTSIDLEAIKKRNEERKAECRLDACDFDDFFLCVHHSHVNSTPDDIDTLLTEIASRDAEIEELRVTIKRLL